MPGRKTRDIIAELREGDVSFDGYFLLAVSVSLPDFAHEIIDRARDRERNGETDSPILNAIYDAALDARQVIIAGNFIGSANTYVDAAVERATFRVLKLLAQDNVLPFSRSWRERS